MGCRAGILGLWGYCDVLRRQAALISGGDDDLFSRARPAYLSGNSPQHGLALAQCRGCMSGVARHGALSGEFALKKMSHPTTAINGLKKNQN